MPSEPTPVSVEDRPFELRLLGPFELVYRPSGEVIPVTSARMRALMAYLAVAPRYTESRQRMAGLLWPGKEDELARQSLRQLLSQFRRAAGIVAKGIGAAGLVDGDGETLRLDVSRIAIDRSIFLNVTDDADIAMLMSAVALYRRDFGTGLEIGEPEFDDWLATERVRCRDTAIQSLDRLVRALGDAGRCEEALRYANGLAGIDPLREETHRLVIAQEAAVSGRASAMSRFEQFRLLLREELGVRPEAATLQLLDVLRRQPSADPPPSTTLAPSPSMAGAVHAPAVHEPADLRPALTHRLRLLAPMAGVMLVLLAGVIGFYLTTIADTAATAGRRPSDADKRVVVAFTPFGLAKELDRPPDQAGLYENEVRRIFAQNERLSVATLPSGTPTGDPIEIARGQNATYLMKTEVSASDDGPKATAFLYDVKTGKRIYAGVAFMSGNAEKFARRYYDLMYPALLLDHAHVLSEENPNSVETLVWEASVDEVRHGDRTADPPEMDKLEKVITQEPQNLDALVGLAWSLIHRAASDRSSGLNRTDDLYRGAWRLQQARQLEEAQLETLKSRPATLSKMAYLEGLLDKVEGRFADARVHFVEALRYAPGSAQAAAQVAHVDLFLGSIEEAYAEMEAIPNFDYAESSFIAAETALMAHYPDRALFYYDHAVSANPDIPRNYAWRAIALWRLHRKDEAHKNALKSQEMKPAYFRYWIANRSNLGGKRYRDERNECLKDFELALHYETPS